MTEPEFRALLDRYLAGEATPAERQLLDKFFDLYRDKDGGEVLHAGEIREEILEAVRRKNAPGIKLVPAARSFTALKIAASIALVAMVGYFIYFQNAAPGDLKKTQLVQHIERIAYKGQKLDVQLPDGTKVKLNSNSRLTYSETSFDNSREVTIEGEAFFDVVHNPAKPFIVHTGTTAIRVLGTTFNVNASQGTTLAVTLVTGKVNVATPGASASLLPNQQAVVNLGSHAIDTKAVDVSKYIGWKDNTLVFENTRLSEALTVLENWYNVNIEADHAALKNCVVTGRYENQSLENVLKSFQFMLDIDFKINNRKVTLQGKGCP